MPESWRNWAGNQSCAPAAIYLPIAGDEISSIVTAAAGDGQKVRVVGSGHSFNEIALTKGVMIDLSRHNRIFQADSSSGLVTVEAGITLADLNNELALRGLAIENLGDIEYQTLGGAISTGTHGTGARYRSISAQVAALELIAADGTTCELSPEKDPETFRAAQVSLGALGIISTVTLQCVPAFRLRSEEKPWRLAEVLEQLDELVLENDHVDLYWYPHTDVAQTLIHNRTDEPVRTGGRMGSYARDVVLENYAFNLICYLGSLNSSWIPSLSRFVGRQIGTTTIVDRSDRVFTNQRLVRFVEMEYAVPRAAVSQALITLRRLIDQRGFKISFPVEMRFLAPDEACMSMAYGRDTAFVAVHVYHRSEALPFFKEVEALMRDLQGRPHWGKMHYRSAKDLRPLYPEWDKFIAARDRLDPQRLFSNDYLERVLS